MRRLQDGSVDLRDDSVASGHGPLFALLANSDLAKAPVPGETEGLPTRSSERHLQNCTPAALSLAAFMRHRINTVRRDTYATRIARVSPLLFVC